MPITFDHELELHFNLKHQILRNNCLTGDPRIIFIKEEKKNIYPS